MAFRPFMAHDVNQKIQLAISRLLKAGFQVSPATLQMLEKQDDPLALVDQFLANNEVSPREIPVLEPVHLHTVPVDEGERSTIFSSEVSKEKPVPTPSKKRVTAEDIKVDIKVMKDPSQSLKSRGILEDFKENFRDRYYRLRGIIEKRIDGRGVVDIKEAARGGTSQEIKRGDAVKIVGLITDRIQAKSGNLVLELEDPSGRIMVVVPQKERELLMKAQGMLLDQVICVEGALVSSDMLIARDLFLPDIPVTRRPHHAKEDVWVALISDIHFGSQQFLEPVFNRFLNWIQGEEGNDEQVDLSRMVKYLVINGDLVDGIGVYPNQLADIKIHDLDGQYNGLAKLLDGIPRHIHVIITPGNHDGVRTAIPRPTIDERFIGPLRDKGLSITSLGCPCMVSLHGVNVLIYHGDSLVDIMGALSKPETEASFMAMREALRGRHLAPIYGKRTSIVAEPRDWLVIDEVPDIFHCGHVHVNSVGSYRKTLIINSGTFQSQTDYQRLSGINPTPGIVPLVNLKTLNVKSLNFV